MDRELRGVRVLGVKLDEHEQRVWVLWFHYGRNGHRYTYPRLSVGEFVRDVERARLKTMKAQNDAEERCETS